MRISWVAALLASSIAVADPAPEPDLVLHWETGEQSKELQVTRTRLTVFGNKLHYWRAHLGKGPAGEQKPVELDAIVKDPKKVAAALARLDKLAATPSKKTAGPIRKNLRTGCVRRGKAERCVSVDGEDKDPDDLKAIAAVRDALLDGVKLPTTIATP